VVVIEPKQVVAHSDNRRKILDTVVVLEVRVHAPDELRDLRSHASLDVKLRDWQRRKTRFAHSATLKLAAVKLIRATYGGFQAELEKILDLRPKLSVITDLDEVLDAGHEGGDDVRLHHFGCFFADDDLQSETAEHLDVSGQACGCDANNIGL
jgi:hypothetical protein